MRISKKSSQGRWYRPWVLKHDKQAGSRISFCPECPGVSASSPMAWSPACLNHKGRHSLAREWGCSGFILEPRGHEGNHRWPPGGRDESLLNSCHYHWKSNLFPDSQCGQLGREAQGTDPQRAESQMPQARTVGRLSPLDLSVCFLNCLQWWVGWVPMAPSGFRPCLVAWPGFLLWDWRTASQTALF